MTTDALPLLGTADEPPTVLVGGVSELFQGDLDFGRHVVERLQAEQLGRHVVVEEMHYGAIAVMQRIEDLRPAALILVGAARRDRPPGTVQRRRLHRPAVTAAEIQQAVGDAVTGYVAIDLVVEIAAGFDVLPRYAVAVELEPVDLGPGERTSPEAADAIVTAAALIRGEVRRVPALQIAGALAAAASERPTDGATDPGIVRRLLKALGTLAEEGRWGPTFTLADQLRHAITRGEADELTNAGEWAMCWGLLEELDRLRAEEAVGVAPEPTVSRSAPSGPGAGGARRSDDPGR